MCSASPCHQPCQSSTVNTCSQLFRKAKTAQKWAGGHRPGQGVDALAVERETSYNIVRRNNSGSESQLRLSVTGHSDWHMGRKPCISVS